MLPSMHSESLGRWGSFVFMNESVKVCEARMFPAKANQHSTHLSEDVVIYFADDEV